MIHLQSHNVLQTPHIHIQEVKPSLSPTPEIPKLFTNGIARYLSSDHFFHLIFSFLCIDALLIPNESGHVKVEEVVTYWQDLGIEAPDYQNLETFITKV